ncbi:sensor histidine kinase [Cohnella zeiphila]|uniref:histidine kinase n=1 Tax=Cohnella zeiphila TaxID=2761120 RepID=A0A7X0STU1_9BACL|nr:sensor histidine kinase [Cohnella zeiphila]MBB6734775.1 sensor histidine kinase [Cohnella zeiphila]
MSSRIWRSLTVWKTMNLRQKLIVSYLIVVMIPLTILGGYAYRQSRESQIQQSNLLMQDNLNKISLTLGSKIERYDAAIDLIGFNPGLEQVFNNAYTDYFSMYLDLRDKVDPLLNSVKSLNNDIRSIVIYTENNLTPRTGSILPIGTIADAPWYAAALKEAETQWHYENGKLFGAKRIFSNVDGDLKNLVYLQVDPNKFFDIVGDTELRDYRIAVADETGVPLFAMNGGRGSEAEGKSLKKEIPGTGWSVSIYTSTQSINARVNAIIKATVILESICVVLVLLFIWLFSKGFVRRIHRLIRKMKMVEQGDFHIPAQTDSPDEIGDLERRFIKMLTSIKALIEEVYQSKIDGKNAELRALQAQINPHFLYNSLSIINWQAIDSDNREISRITNLLSVFYRTSLNQGNNEIRFKDELENTKSYMEIQLIMHDYSFDAVYDIEESLMECIVIKLILQPIVENALEHGIDKKRSGRGVIRIAAEREGPNAAFTVEDNGPGMEQEVADKILTRQSKGYGLFNVNERIRMQYGIGYGVTISSRPGEGAKVRVTIPVSLEPIT